jgi:hypothetical protein
MSQDGSDRFGSGMVSSVGDLYRSTINIEDLTDLRTEFRVLDRKTGLHATEKVPRHPVRTREINFWIAGVFETVDPAVLQKSSDDAPNGYVVAHSRHFWAQATDTRPGKPCKGL